MSINSIERPVVAARRLTVPWSMVLPLAAVMAYADGFWMTTLRGAVGAIERVQQPFAGWWRESTVLLPVFVLVVLGALTLAVHLFGPVLRTPRAVAATALLIVAAGTAAAIALIVVSSAYDYHLQSNQLQFMDLMHHLCVRSCLAQQQQATLAGHIRGVSYTSGLLLLTNVVLVGWVVAMRGGRLAVSTIGRRRGGAFGSSRMAGSRAGNVRFLLVAGLFSSAAIHAAVIPQHLTEWPAAGVFFIILTAAQIIVAGVLLARLNRSVLLAAAVVSLGPLVLWLYSRLVGLPFGPGAGLPEDVGLPDVVAGAVELGTLLAAVLMLRAAGRLQQRPPASAHARGLQLVAIIAVTAIGIAGTAPTWFDGSDTNGNPSVMTVSH